MKPFVKISGLVLVLLLSCLESLQGQLVLGGQDVQVNSTTANNQNRPAAAQAGNGQGLLVWESSGQDGDGYGVFGQYFSAAGAPVGSEFQISSETDSEQRMPDVAMDDNGNAAIVWMDDQRDGDGWGIYYKLFDANGNSTTSDIRTNSTSSGVQKFPKVAMSDDGTFSMVWMSENIDGDDFGIVMRWYASSGAALTAQVQVNDSVKGYQGHPDIARDSAGNFVVVWQSEDYDGDGNGIFAKIYDVGGNVLANEFQVNATSAGNQQEPSVGMDKNGNITVTWSSFDSSTDLYQVYGRRFDLSGNAISGEFLISGTTNIGHDHSDLAVTQEGDFAVTWSSYGSDGDAHGVYMQAYDATGTANGGEALINSTTDDYQQHSGTAWRNSSLDLIMAWQSGTWNSTSTQDASGYGIFFKVGSLGDTEAPVAVCQDLTVQLDGTGMVGISENDVDGGSSDNIGITSSSIDVSSFDCADLGANAVVLTLADAAGNTSTCTSNVTVEDVTTPTALCANFTLALDANGTANLTGAQIDGGSSDNCSISSLTVSQSAFSCADLGAQSVTLTASDASGNTATCTANVTVEDNTAPTAVCQNITVQLNASGTASVMGSQVDGGSSDNCSFSTALSQSSFDCADLGGNAVTLTVTDGTGNSATCAATVTVEDVIAPTAVCGTFIAELDASGNASVTAADVDGGSSDNCSLSLSLDKTTFSCADLGSNGVTLTASDGSQTSSCAATVTVEDNLAPSLTCQNTTVSLNASGSASISAGDVTGSVSDNCSVSNLSLNVSSFDCADFGSNTVSLTATDSEGNSTSCNATVTVQDNIAPSASCKNITVNLDGTGTASINASDVDNGSSDNCSVSLSVSDNSFNCNDVGSNNVTLTATDGAGNTDNCTATVTVEDVTAPTLTCPATATYDCVSEIPSANVSQVTASDNCGSPSISVNDDYSILNSSCGSGWHKFDRVFTALDNSGNVSSCSWRIQVAIATYSQGSNTFCLEKVKVTPSCTTPNCAYVTSTGSLSKVTLRDQNGNNHTINSPGGKSGTFCHPSGLPLKKVWVRSGCYNGNGGKGYAFPLCNGTSKTGGEEIEIEFDPGMLGALSLDAWPNPTDGVLQVQLSDERGFDAEYEVQVVDMMGKVLESRNIDMQGGHSTMDFDLSDYSVGMYYIVVDGAGERLTKKIVKR